MASLQHTSNKYKFVWFEDSDVIEVFRKHDLPEAPFEAVLVPDLKFNIRNLKRFILESEEYS